MSLHLDEGRFGRKNQPKPPKKNPSKPQTACKTDKFSHPHYQNPQTNQSDAAVTSGAYRGFAAIRYQ